jgi:hypothetical protein
MAVTNPQVWDLSDEQRAQLEGWLVDFERTWDEGRLAARVRELPAGPLRFPALVELVKIDLERSWQRGRQIAVESYLRDYPELGTPDSVPADLLQAEHEARRQHGMDPSLSEFAARFPRRAEDLRRLLEQGDTAPAAARSTFSQAPWPSTLGPQRPRPEPGPALEQLGRYRILRRLGRGGMGSVYLAHDPQLDRPVALKVPHFGAEDPELLERFYREARAAATLRHPNLCPVYDVGDVNGTPYLAMAYIEGESLAERVRAGPLPPAQAVALVRQLALALEVAHRQGVVHRDIKPGNVMVGRDGEPVLMDFGLARRADRGDVRLTHSGSLLGTPAYMSPEQAEGRTEAIGPASDLYSLGVVLYELLTGQLPFSGTLPDVLWQIRTQQPQRPSALRPDLDPHLEEIVMRALAKKMEDRYPSMGAFAEALTGYLRHEQRRAEPVRRLAPAQSPRPRRPVRWRRWAVALSLLGGLAGLLAVIVIYIRYTGKDGKEKTRKLDAQPGSKVVIETEGGKRIGEVKVPERPRVELPVAAKVSIPAPKRPVDWDVSPDGKSLARIYDEEIQLWDTATGKPRAEMKTASRRAERLAFSRDSRFLAVGSYRRVKVWDLKDGKDLFEFKEPKVEVRGLLFLADGKQLLAVDRNGFACLWDVGTGKVLKTAEVNRAVARGPWYISPDHETVVTHTRGFSSDYGLLNVRSMTSETFRSLNGLNDVAFSTDGKRLLVAREDLVRLFDLTRKAGKEVHRLHTGKVISVSLSPDGKLAASGSEDRTAIVWDVGAGKERATYEGFGGPVRVRFSPDGKMLLAWAVNGTTVRRWDVTAGKELPALGGHEGGVQWGFFRAGGKTLGVAERDGKVTVYNVARLPE